MSFGMFFQHTFQKVAILLAIIGFTILTRKKPIYKIIGTTIVVIAFALYFYAFMFMR